MKPHQTLFATLGISLLTFGAVAQNDLATANDKDGVVLFVESMPANPYRHKGTVSCATFSPDEEEPLIEHMIKQTRKEHEEFDGLIFRSGTGLCKADIIQYYPDPDAKRRRGRGDDEEVNPKHKEAKAVPTSGTMVFMQSSPTAEYQLLGKIETPVTFRSKDVEELKAELIRISKERYKDLDAIVVVAGSNIRKANVIKFK
jgi:hypothetical protein